MAVEERRGRMRRVRCGVLAVAVVGVVEAVVERVGDWEETEAMVKGLRRSFSHGLRRVLGGRPR